MSTDADTPNTSPSTSSTATTSVNTAALPDDPAVLKRMIAELLRELRKERRDKESAERRLDALLRRYYERQANPDQPLLFPDANEAPAAAESPVAAAPEKMTSRRGKCQPHGRRRPARNLRREQRRYELTQAERLCPECGSERQEIGVESTAQYDFKPAEVSFTPLWSYFGLNIADLSSDRRMFVAPAIWQTGPGD